MENPRTSLLLDCERVREANGNEKLVHRECRVKGDTEIGRPPGGWLVSVELGHKVVPTP